MVPISEVKKQRLRKVKYLLKITELQFVLKILFGNPISLREEGLCEEKTEVHGRRWVVLALLFPNMLCRSLPLSATWSDPSLGLQVEMEEAGAPLTFVLRTVLHRNQRQAPRPLEVLLTGSSDATQLDVP